MQRSVVRSSLLFSMAISITSCATLISGSMQTVKVSSNPSGATVKVEPGFYEVKTPAELSLKRKEGPYRLTIAMDGYEPVQAYLKASTNGWLWGNILFGGIIGIIIDYSTGAATALSPTEVHADLENSEVHYN